MIIVRSPLRITLGGGGTDLQSYYQKNGGFCISAAISKYVYVCINHTFFPGITLKYSEMEHTKNSEEIKHPIFREALEMIGLSTPQVEIASIADVPSNGAGLGNSGAFTVALLKALYCYKNIPKSQEIIAEMACYININKLNKAQGKQDEYISSFGGITCFEFSPLGTVTHYPLNISHDTLVDLEENTFLFYTGVCHDTQSILEYQDLNTKANNDDMISNLDKIKAVGIETCRVLERGYTEDFGELLNVQWELKQKRMPDRNYLLESLREDFLKKGALGVKIVGSGLGGFFLVYAESERERIRDYAKRFKMEELRFQFDFEGCKRMV